MPDRKFFTLREAAEELGVPYQRVRRKLRAFGIPVEKIGCTITVAKEHMALLKQEERTWGRKKDIKKVDGR